MPEWIRNSDLLKSKNVTGIEMHIMPDNTYSFKITNLIRDRKKIRVEEYEKGTGSFDDLTPLIKSKNPICLSIDGKGIVHKKVDITAENNILNQVMPNANPESFYVQQISVSNENAFVSIIRKEVIQAILNEFKNRKLFVINLSLGPFIINSITSLLHNNHNEIETDSYSLHIDNNRIVDFFKNKTDKKSEEVIVIGDESISKEYIISFSSAFYYYFPGQPEDSVLLEEVTLNEEFSYKQVLKYTSRGFLILIFVILLVNFLLYDYYSKKKNEYLLLYNKNESQIELRDTLNKQLEQKEKLLDNIGILSTSRLSYYADQLALKLPANITLTKMLQNPVKNKIRKEVEILFERNTIHIEGTTSKSIDLHDWIEDISEESWVDNVVLLNYEQENSAIPGEFSIELKLKP